MPLTEEDSMYLTNVGLDLLKKMFLHDPSKRTTASEALKHPWFSEEPLPVDLEDMP